MAKKIYLSPSDQYGNVYAYGNTNEGAQCNIIADHLASALLRCGFEVYRNENMYMAVRESNNVGADLHIAIHTNAFDGKVTGTRVHYYRDNSEGHRASKVIYDQLHGLYEGANDADNINPAPTLYEIKNTVAPCVYIECEFHDNPAAAKWIIGHTVEIAEAIAAGVCYHFNEVYIAPETPNDPGNHYIKIGPFATREERDNFLLILHQAHNEEE